MTSFSTWCLMKQLSLREVLLKHAAYFNLIASPTLQIFFTKYVFCLELGFYGLPYKSLLLTQPNKWGNKKYHNCYLHLSI
jgi:hypothetical protein